MTLPEKSPSSNASAIGNLNPPVAMTITMSVVSATSGTAAATNNDSPAFISSASNT
jgi:hypothetical protein